MSLNEELKALVSTVDGGLACAVIDLNTGLMMGAYHNVPYFTQSYVDAVGAAAVDMFRGRTISTVEKLLATQRGDDVSKSVLEVQMTTKGTYHFMAVIPDKPDALIVLITNHNTNLGMGWIALRKASVEIAPLCP